MEHSLPRGLALNGPEALEADFPSKLARIDNRQKQMRGGVPAHNLIIIANVATVIARNLIKRVSPVYYQHRTAIKPGAPLLLLR